VLCLIGLTPQGFNHFFIGFSAPWRLAPLAWDSTGFGLGHRLLGDWFLLGLGYFDAFIYICLVVYFGLISAPEI